MFSGANGCYSRHGSEEPDTWATRVRSLNLLRGRVATPKWQRHVARGVWHCRSMRWSSEHAREIFAASRVARLATVSADCHPHLVPVTFVAHEDTVATAVDTKPKSTTNLKRLANITANPRVCLLADEYDDDWDRLWWARADGQARIAHAGAEREAALERLARRYPQYDRSPPTGPVILVDVHRWSGWSYR